MAISIFTEEYLRNEAMKGNKQQTENKLNKLTDKIAKIHNSEQISKMEMERTDAEPKVIQQAGNMNTEQNERPPQSNTNKTVDKRELN